MDSRKEQLAAQAIRRAVMTMQRTAPGLLPVYMGITGIPTDDPSVAVRVGVNGGSPVMEYNVDFVTSLEPSLLGAIVYMECERIALHHCDRRKQEPLDMLKLASDVVVAEYARKIVDTSVGKNLEIVNRLFPSFWNYWPVLEKHGFNPETDLTLEKLFAIFKEEYATMQQEEEEDDGKEQEKPGEKSRDEHRTESRGTGKDARQRDEGSKDGTENAENSGSPGESQEQGDGKEDGSSGESGKDKGEEDSGETGDGGQGDSGDGERDPGQDSDGGEPGESGGNEPSGEDSGEDSGEEGCDSDGSPEDSGDDEGGSPGQGGDGSSGDGADGGSVPSGNPGGDADGDTGEGDGSDGDGDDGSAGDSGSPSEDVDGGPGRGEVPKDDFSSMSRYFSLTNAGSDLERWGQDDVARDSVTSTVNEALDKGMFDRVRGPLPIMLRNANRVKVDKEAMFRKFMTSLQDDERDETWSRRNRKFIRYGMIAPGYVYRETQRILFCVDVSGSMYQGDSIANCLTVMENVVNGLSIDLVYWDAVCSPVFNAPKSIRDMAIYGGGRTDPECVLRKLGPERYKYDGLIFLTDCIFQWRRPPRHKQIMILRTHGEHEFPEWCVYKDELERFIGH